MSSQIGLDQILEPPCFLSLLQVHINEITITCLSINRKAIRSNCELNPLPFDFSTNYLLALTAMVGISERLIQAIVGKGQ